MLVIIRHAKLGDTYVSNEGDARLRFYDDSKSTVLISHDNPEKLLTILDEAAAKLRSDLAKREPVATDANAPALDDTPVISVPVADVIAGDRIRIGGWWHTVAEMNARGNGYVIRTTRNDYFGYDYAERVTLEDGSRNA
jgi:hypothetical protein